MKKETLSILFIAFIFASCQKEVLEEVVLAKQVPCVEQKINPAGRSYVTDSLIEYQCTEKHCGFISLSTKNYWVYQDSIFTDGVFVNVKMDTLRYNKTYLSKKDGLTWWKGNKEIGLPKILYANDSSFFSADILLFSPETTAANKSYGLFTGDSVRYLSNIEDIRATGRSLKINEDVYVPAGKFTEVLLFEKNANFFGSDQLLYKQGVGVLKFTQMRVPVGDWENKKQIVSTLVAYHIE